MSIELRTLRESNNSHQHSPSPSHPTPPSSHHPLPPPPHRPSPAPLAAAALILRGGSESDSNSSPAHSSCHVVAAINNNNSNNVRRSFARYSANNHNVNNSGNANVELFVGPDGVISSNSPSSRQQNIVFPLNHRPQPRFRHSLHVETVTRSAPNLNGLANETGSGANNDALVSSSSTMASMSNNQINNQVTTTALMTDLNQTYANNVNEQQSVRPKEPREAGYGGFGSEPSIPAQLRNNELPSPQAANLAINRSTVLRGGAVNSSGGSTSARYVEPPNDLYAPPTDMFSPPDGGFTAWIVCFTAFWTNGVIFGILNSFGVLLVDIIAMYEKQGMVHSTFKSTWIGSVCIGTTFLLSSLSSYMTDQWGIRKTAALGGLMAWSGMFTSSFVCSSLPSLFTTYGVVLGFGFSLSYTPSLVILGHYFRRRLATVNYLVTSGSAIFTMFMPILVRWFLYHVGLKTTFQILSAFCLSLIACAATWRPIAFTSMNGYSKDELEGNQDRNKNPVSRFCSRLCRNVSFQIWRNNRYVLYIFAIIIGLFGYFIPYFHLFNYAQSYFEWDKIHSSCEENDSMSTTYKVNLRSRCKSSAALLITCIGLTSGLSRVLFGRIADMAWVNRIRLQQVALILIGLSSAVIPFIPKTTFSPLVIICLLLGFFDGCFVCLLGPIVYDIVGPQNASHGIGFLLGLLSIPMITGPPLAGWIRDYTGEYKMAFWVAGAPPIFGFFLLFFVRRVNQYYPKCNAAQNVDAVDSQ